MLDLARQYAPIREEILAAMAAVLDQRQFILGEPVASFERMAAQSLGVREAVGCASGTDALWLALAAAGIGQGMAVVTTPFSFFASVSSIVRAGARPLLCDIEPESFNIDPKRIKELLESRQDLPIGAILPVHLYGQCVAWDDFAELAREHGLRLVEDAAQAWGASWNGRPAGGLGDIAAFSFYPTKNLNAAGDAGLVTTNDPELAERTRMLRQHGMRQRYHHDEMGWNARMDGFQGAVLQVNLRHLPERDALRRAAAERYHALFAKAGLAEPGTYPDKGVVLPKQMAGSHHVWHQYVIRTRRRDALRDFLTARQIGSEVYYPIPLHRQKALEYLGYAKGSFPEAERASREVLALPIFPEIRPDEQERVVGVIAEFLS
jgi:dTDP-4-amino-4,6-dideoxygalactose transaminase